ncbi:MAG: iron-sulfur cluster repair di-iron protein [Chitinophagales bacterium]|nr:iron-sulfur cluster repair di-iron protein [Chitinophagales bacterium]
MSSTEELIINVPSIEPRFKHATIFQAYENLGFNESMIIRNDHDPRPVFFQLQGLHGNTFTWEYLEQGPEWYIIRVTKKDPNAKEEIIINVPAIEPRYKHATIFQTYENLEPEQSMIIRNDHDPRPVYFQLANMHGEDTFDWEYLEQGPEWWNIRVTKKEIYKKGEPIVNVPSIEPRLKHFTIFQTYENLEPGQSMIIRNDHDPRPVYFQLANKHGDTFTWEYLQQGPQWFIIRVSKKKVEVKLENQEPATKHQNQEIILNIPSLEPRLKHPTIFKTFDELKGGESFIIHNDHDPKPVYYQLLGERGDVFTWEYLLQGPQWWDIRVTKRSALETETIGQIVAKDLRKVEIFKKYGIDFCCGGRKTVREVCAEKGIDHQIVEKELQQPAQNLTGNQNNYNEWNIDFLADFIVNTHHQYIKKYLPEIKGYATKVAQVHGSQHPELIPILKLINQIQQELTEHIEKEETQLFPLIKQIAIRNHKETTQNQNDKISLMSQIEKLENEHDEVGEGFDKIRELSNQFAIPEDACTSYQLLYKMIQEFEDDLHIHIHLENNILFPKAIEME